jgi:hypothetical protein
VNARPYVCKLEPGDVLWMNEETWHDVSSWDNDEGYNLAVNWWCRGSYRDYLPASTLANTILREANSPFGFTGEDAGLYGSLIACGSHGDCLTPEVWRRLAQRLTGGYLAATWTNPETRQGP